jgi:hypothetical protein
MTVLGKILVIVNFVFSLIAAALIVFLNAASTNWHEVAEKQKALINTANTNADTYRAELESARQDAKGKFDTLAAQLKEVERQRDTFKAQNEEHRNKYEKTDETKKAIDASRDAITAELKRRKDEIDHLNTLMAQRDRKMLELEKEKKDFRDRAVLAEINQKSEQERNEKLLAQLESMSKEVQRLQAGNGGSRLASMRNPPAEDVEGVIKAMDAQTGYLTLSIGSDAGLSRGNTLDVFRLSPEARYLGTVQVLDVKAHEAVAKPVDGRRGTLRIGDRVASSITGRR